MGKKQFIHQANKKTDRNWDAKKLDKLQRFLIKYSLGSIREKTISSSKFTTSNKIRLPDLIISKEIIAEHDTVKIHGELGYENERTLRRNGDYVATERNFVVINEDLCDELGLEEGPLLVYLYFHEVMKINAKKEAENRNG